MTEEAPQILEQEERLNKKPRFGIPETMPDTGGGEQSETPQLYNKEVKNLGRPVEHEPVEKIFGNTQGPAGSAISELPSISEANTGQSTEQPSEFEPGIVGIEDRTQSGDQEGADAALRAADKARMRGSSDDAVLDALEAAETVYDSSHSAAEQPGKLNRKLSLKMEASEGGSGSPSSSGRSGGKKGLQPEESDRQKIRKRFTLSMEKNAALARLKQAERDKYANTFEEACRSSSSSRPVYISKAGNMARLLGKTLSISELSELPRIASGASRQVAHGTTTEEQPTRDNITGLQGIVMK